MTDEQLEHVASSLREAKQASGDGERANYLKAALGEARYAELRGDDHRVTELRARIEDAIVCEDDEVPFFANRGMDLVAEIREKCAESSCNPDSGGQECVYGGSTA